MKIWGTLMLFTLLLSIIVTTTAATATVTSFSCKNKNREVCIDPQVQELLSSKPADFSERMILTFDQKVNVNQRVKLLSTIKDLKLIKAYKLIPAACVITPLSTIKNIKKLEGIKAIWLDREVKALSSSNQIFHKQSFTSKLSDSIDLINAPSLWSLNINGSGMTIAVVDTGINWNHESLDDLDDNPATYDPKVIANVSFVPDVPTGFDDNGHGTHVAGIAAGTGGPSHVYMGVAPGAKLYAVKVLNASGVGYDSWVIAGIEWSVEHNADVITMSLGGYGYPYDPLSMASNTAVDRGVVVVVAAGNSGPQYMSVGSPGLADKVITVGATTKEDTVASFSSRGPNTYDYRADPDVVAPGVGIMSADASNVTGYIPMSGTSMATPHVAGAAALLLQAFPNATPPLITSALMSSAVNIGYDSYTQGAGRIDVLAAYNLINNSIKQGTLHLQSSSPLNKPQYIMFGNSRVQFVVDDYGDIVGLSFDNRDQLAVMAWRIAYNTSNLASWQDLEIVQPMIMRVHNETYQQAFGAFRTLDKAAAVFLMIELFRNETWARITFKVWPLNSTLQNLRIFYIEDVGMNGNYENDWAYYYSSQDTIVVNDTSAPPQAQHFGFGGTIPSSAHHVGEYPSAWEAAYYDKLNNSTQYIGDENNAFKWSLGTTKTPSTISVIFGLEYNVSEIFHVINEGRSTPPTSFNITFHSELQVSIHGPTVITPETTESYKITVSNHWIGNAVNAKLKLHLDDVSLHTYTLNVTVGNSVEVNISISVVKGMHILKAEIFSFEDPLLRNNIAEKRIFADTMFSAILPLELEVNTYTDFGPFSSFEAAWVNLTIITPNKISDATMRLTGNLSQVISFVNSPYIGDIKGWKYFTFEAYASGVPNCVYSGFVEIVSQGVTVNKLPVTVKVSWNPVPKINGVFLNDTSVFRVTETLGVTINVTDLDEAGRTTPTSMITVNVYLLNFDLESFEWKISEGPFPAEFNPLTGLFEFSYTFPADHSLGEFGVGVEAVDSENGTVRAMPRLFYLKNNVPIVNTTVYPENIVGNETVNINVTVSDVETPFEQLRLEAYVLTPAGEKEPVQLTFINGVFTTTFNDTCEEGEYVVFVTVTDADGASSLSIQAFRVDNTPPLVLINSPKNGSAVSETINITFTVWDANLVNASLIINSEPPINVTGETSFLLNTTELPDGQCTIKLSAFDLAGNQAEAYVTIIVDNTVPSARITAPENGSCVRDTVTLNFTGVDANFQKMNLYINGVLKQTWKESGEQTYYWNTRSYTDGSYTIKLTVYDEAGNLKTAETTVTVDNTMPTTVLISPEEDSVVSGTVNVTFSFSDANLENATLLLDGNVLSEVTDKCFHLWNTSQTPDGEYTLALTVTDKAENSRTVERTVTVDNTPPTAQIRRPLESSYIRGSYNILIYGYDVNLDRIELYVNESPVAIWNKTGIYTYNWNTTADGTYTIKLLVKDKAGNNITDTVTVIVDNTQPTLSITSPKDKARLSGVVNINFTASDDNLNKVFLSIDNTTFNVTGKSFFTWDTTSVGDGTHRVTLTAYDKAGNENETTITVIIVNVEQQVETVRNLYLGVGIVIGLIIGALAVYVIHKRKRP